MKLAVVTRDFLAVVKEFASIDKEQYPETLGRLFIINTPSAFPFVWRMVKGFLDPGVTMKIQVLGNESEWKPVLFDFIGEENLSSTYGGLLPELSVDVHPYKEVMEMMAKERKDKERFNQLVRARSPSRDNTVTNNTNSSTISEDIFANRDRDRDRDRLVQDRDEVKEKLREEGKQKKTARKQFRRLVGSFISSTASSSSSFSSPAHKKNQEIFRKESQTQLPSISENEDMNDTSGINVNVNPATIQNEDDIADEEKEMEEEFGKVAAVFWG